MDLIATSKGTDNPPIVFEARNPDYEQVVRTMFADQPFMTTIGATLGRLAPGYAEIYLPFRREVSQHNGFFHGGIIGTLADNSGGSAGYTMLEPGARLLTVEFKVNILAPGTGDSLLAKGRVIRAGRNLIVSSSEVYACVNGRETLCATQLMTLMVLSGEDPDPEQE